VSHSKYAATSSYIQFEDAARSLALMFIRKASDREFLVAKKKELNEPSDDDTIEEVRNLIKKSGLPVFI
jgi:hypothetical protein